jgi:hypothetical protein
VSPVTVGHRPLRATEDSFCLLFDMMVRPSR